LIGDITYAAETIIPYGKNLMFWPIPFEMLETYEEKPQVKVMVDDMPAVCHSMDCGFLHVPAVGTVKSFSLAGMELTLTGTDLPDNISKIQSITYANSNCTASSSDPKGTLSGTEVKCTLDRTPTCGAAWIPALTTAMGNVANDKDLKG